MHLIQTLLLKYIFLYQVYEEKERMWEREVRKIKSLYENRIKANQQKASKMEAALLNQTYQVYVYSNPSPAGT